MRLVNIENKLKMCSYVDIVTLIFSKLDENISGFINFYKSMYHAAGRKEMKILKKVFDV